MEEDDPPQGFFILGERPEVEVFAGPFYERLLADGQRQLGFRVTPRKLNKMGVCHGGVLALFADIQGGPLKRALNLAVDSPTINLSMDFVASAPRGSWVQSQPQLVRQTGGLLFFESKLHADGELCARVSGIYRLKPNGHGSSRRISSSA
ncbi:PaaI family thioesterase [Mesorhizobium sp. L-8-10]|uniref:PaaI family thioesterase n=1 Tax=Mesorhizobium sp. L-8-10 TaxID=2744523 RepID=UPI0019287E39|nr:PaaI family thioesterase [Mesorhizobium sp. L-8-10]